MYLSLPWKGAEMAANPILPAKPETGIIVGN